MWSQKARVQPGCVAGNRVDKSTVCRLLPWLWWSDGNAISKPPSWSSSSLGSSLGLGAFFLLQQLFLGHLPVTGATWDFPQRADLPATLQILLSLGTVLAAEATLWLLAPELGSSVPWRPHSMWDAWARHNLASCPLVGWFRWLDLPYLGCRPQVRLRHRALGLAASLLLMSNCSGTASP